MNDEPNMYTYVYILSVCVSFSNAAKLRMRIWARAYVRTYAYM